MSAQLNKINKLYILKSASPELIARLEKVMHPAGKGNKKPPKSEND